MSSDAGEAVMGEKKTVQALVPQLRFPEFRDSGEWAQLPLGAFARLINERVGDRKITPLSITSGVGLLSQEAKFGRTIAGQQLKNYVVLRKGDYAYNKSATKLYPQGYAVMYEGDELGCVPSSIFTCFGITEKSISNQYINHLLSANLHGRWLSQFTTIGARANGSLNVDDDDLLALPVPLPQGPSKLVEQQKISRCLSSLDAVIAAEGERLAALRDHKKGMMQALFPAPGQTTPSLRFQEFQNTGEWHNKPLDGLCEILNNRRQPVSRVDRQSGSYPYYGASGIVDYISEYIFDDRLLLVGEDGAKWGAFEATAFLVEGQYWVNNHAHVLRATGVNDRFLEQYLVKTDLANFVSGAAPPKLTLGKLRSIPIPVPPSREEQRRIAECLAALDEVIGEQRARIEQLKTHKSGLMQQLFPSPAEAAG